MTEGKFEFMQITSINCCIFSLESEVNIDLNLMANLRIELRWGHTKSDGKLSTRGEDVRMWKLTCAQKRNANFGT